MKHWRKFKFSPPLKNKEAFLKRNKIIEDENLTEELKFLIEIKTAQIVWHSKEEIIEHLKNLTEAAWEAKRKERLENPQPKVERKRKSKKIPIDQIFETKTTLLEKEMLKDVNGLDHLILAFENLEKKVVVFPNKFKERWEQLNVGEKYSIKYFEQESENPNHDKFILLGFKHLSKAKKKTKIKKTKKIKVKIEKELELFKTEARLLVKEQLKNFKNKDYLLLTFENIERNLLNFPNKGKNRWDQLIENETYEISIFKRDEVEHKRDLLVNFKNVKDLKEEKTEKSKETNN